MGYQYVAICDYVSTSDRGPGLTTAMLARQIRAIRELNGKLPDTFRLLAGAEVEISADGHLQADEALLSDLDLVIAGIHTGLKAPLDQLTQRLCKVMEHPLVQVLAHPTNRMLGKPGVPRIDMDAILETAVETGTCLEINGHVLRLDLPDLDIRRARDLGITFSLGSDAQTIQEMRSMRLGVLTARRGWTEARQVLNSLPTPRLLQRLRPRDVSHAS